VINNFKQAKNEQLNTNKTENSSRDKQATFRLICDCATQSAKVGTSAAGKQNKNKTKYFQLIYIFTIL